MKKDRKGSCAKAEELAALATDKMLSAQEAKELEEHIKTCPGCADRARQLEADSAALRAFRAAAPEGFARGVFARIERAEAARKKRPFPLYRVLTAAAAAAVLTVGALRFAPGAFEKREAPQAETVLLSAPAGEPAAYAEGEVKTRGAAPGGLAFGLLVSEEELASGAAFVRAFEGLLGEGVALLAVDGAAQGESAAVLGLADREPAARFVTDGGVYFNTYDITPEEQAELAPRGVSAEAAGEGAPAGAKLILYNLPPGGARRAGGK